MGLKEPMEVTDEDKEKMGLTGKVEVTDEDRANLGLGAVEVSDADLDRLGLKENKESLFKKKEDAK